MPYTPTFSPATRLRLRNYDLSYQGNNLTITKALLNVIADAKTKGLGDGQVIALVAQVVVTAVQCQVALVDAR